MIPSPLWKSRPFHRPFYRRSGSFAAVGTSNSKLLTKDLRKLPCGFSFCKLESSLIIALTRCLMETAWTATRPCAHVNCSRKSMFITLSFAHLGWTPIRQRRFHFVFFSVVCALRTHKNNRTVLSCAWTSEMDSHTMLTANVCPGQEKLVPM